MAPAARLIHTVDRHSGPGQLSWRSSNKSFHHGNGLVVFVVYGPNPLEYVGAMTWQEKVLTRVTITSFLTPVFFA
jgi:hypothetical protein